MFVHSAQESEDYIFMHCSTRKDIRAMILSWCNMFLFTVGSLQEFLNAIDANHSSNRKDALLSAIIVAYVWLVWTLRNSLNFNNKVIPMSVIMSKVISNSFYGLRKELEKWEVKF